MSSWLDYGILVPATAKGQIKVECPKCQHTRQKHHRDKPLSVNIAEGVWNCFHCGWTGTLSDRKNSYHNFKPKKNYRIPEYKKAEPIDKVVEWFSKRGISAATLKKHEIGHSSHYFPQTEKIESCIQFPYKKDGIVVNIKYRDGRKNFCQEKDAEPVAFNFDSIKGRQEIIIVEGEIDCLSIEEAGFDYSCSVPNGAINENDKSTDGKLEFISSLQETIESAKKIIIAVDSDSSGKRLESELARRIGKEKCWRTVWPEGCKDANDVLVKYGKDKLRELIENAESYPIEGLLRFSEFEREICDIYENGYKQGESTGWLDIDEYYTVRRGELTIITGVPSHGKSSWLDHLLINLANMKNWRFAIFSPENYPIERHFASLAEKIIKKPFNRGYSERMSKEDLEMAIDWIDKMFYPLAPNENDYSLDTILSLARAAVCRYGVNGVVLDPWNEIDHLRPIGMSETEYISLSLTKIRRFARINDVHFWVVAHPTKLYRDKDGNYPVPNLYDISGSAHWRNKTDNGLVIWRDMESQIDEIELHVQKIRFREIGKTGKAKLRYDRMTGCFSDTKLRVAETVWLPF